MFFEKEYLNSTQLESWILTYAQVQQALFQNHHGNP